MKKKLIPVVCLLLSLYVVVAPLPVHSDYTEIRMYSGNPDWTSH